MATVGIMHRYFKTVRSLSGKRDIFPFYHIASDDPPAHIKHLYKTRTTDQFKLDLEFLLKYYEPVSIEDWIERIPTSKPKMVLSFDDGLREVGEVIAPILKQKGVPAVLFVNSEFVGNQGLLYRYKVSLLIEALLTNQTIPDRIQMILDTSIFDETTERLKSFTFHDIERIDELADALNVDFAFFLKEKRPYLSLSEIKNLETNHDFAIGAHSINHPRFSDITEEDQIHQIKESVAFVQKHFEPKQKLFAFPFTDFGVRDQTIQTLKSEGTIDLSFGTSGIKNEPLPHHIQRIPMESSGRDAHSTLRNEMIGYLLKGLVGKRTVRRV